jgi:serine/threonine-protein kinase
MFDASAGVQADTDQVSVNNGEGFAMRGGVAAAPDAPTAIGVEVVPRLEPQPRLLGAELAGYRLIAEIGRGGMGVVYRAEHLHLGRPAALKVLTPGLASDASFRERFVRESRTAAGLEHPNIVTVYDAGEADGLLYMAMQYVDGSDLAKLLASGPQDPERAVSILGQVASALDAAHARGLVHRDVKPANVLTQGDHAYLTDFGVAKRTADTALTGAGQLVGTMDYLAPEQIKDGPLSPATDVYALGCVLYHCLTGKPPYHDAEPAAVLYAHLDAPPPRPSRERPGLPGGFDAVIARAMAKQSDERYPSCGALVDAARTVAGQPQARSATILVASAAPVTRLLMRGALAGDGFELLQADSSASAAERAREARPDVVVLDWDLDEPSAPAICETLRRDERTAAAKIVAVWPRSEPAAREAALTAGADACVGRPFSSLQLLLPVLDLLDPRERVQ